MGLQKIACNNCHSSEHALLGICAGERVKRFAGDVLNVVVCQQCGLTFLNPQPEEADYRKYYEKGNYAASIGKFVLDRPALLEEEAVQKFFAKYLAQHVNPGDNKKVLDYGCGYGTFLYYLNQEGFLPEGLDPALEIVKRAEKMFGFPVHPQALRENSLPDASYDVVTGVDVIEHSTDPQADMREANRLLKPGGYLYLVTPNFQEVILRRGWNKYFKFVHTHYFTRKTLSSLMEQAGFDIFHSWVIPPVIKYSNVLFPDNFIHGTLCLIGKKKEGKIAPAPYGDDPQDPFQWIEKAKKRDQVYMWAKRSILAYPLYFLRKIVKKKNPYQLTPDSPFKRIP